MSGEGSQRRAVIGAFSAGVVVTALSAWVLTRSAAPTDELSLLGRGVDDVMLVNAHGASVRWGDLSRRRRAVFFGFTHCAVVCPVTVYELTAALDRIGAPGDSVAIEFVTVDPARDTPERLGTYFSGFGPRVTGYTGETEAISRVMRSLGVEARRSELPGGGYTFDHTATVFLIASGRVVEVIAYGTPPEIFDERLRALIVSPNSGG